jgi:hypothetical protein
MIITLKFLVGHNVGHNGYSHNSFETSHPPLLNSDSSVRSFLQVPHLLSELNWLCCTLSTSAVNLIRSNCDLYDNKTTKCKDSIYIDTVKRLRSCWLGSRTLCQLKLYNTELLYGPNYVELDYSIKLIWSKIHRYPYKMLLFFLIMYGLNLKWPTMSPVIFTLYIWINISKILLS